MGRTSGDLCSRPASVLELQSQGYSGHELSSDTAKLNPGERHPTGRLLSQMTPCSVAGGRVFLAFDGGVISV